MLVASQQFVTVSDIVARLSEAVKLELGADFSLFVSGNILDEAVA